MTPRPLSVPFAARPLLLALALCGPLSACNTAPTPSAGPSPVTPSPVTPPAAQPPLAPPAAPSLTLGLPEVTLRDGQDWTVPVQVSRAPDRLEVSGAPAGLSALLSGSELRLRDTGTVPGSYRLTVTGFWGSERRQAALQVTVLAPAPVSPPARPVPTTPAPDFSLGLGQSALPLVSGQSGRLPVAVLPNAALTEAVKLAVTAAPSGLRVGLSGETLLLDAAQTPAGHYTVTVTGTAAGLSRQATLQVSVSAPAQVSSVTLTASRLSLTAGENLDLQATVQGSGAYQPGVTWEVRGDTPALSAQLTSRTDGSAALSVPAGAPGGTLTVTARSVHDPSRLAQLQITVQVPVAPPPTAPAPSVPSGYVWYPGSDRAASADELEILRLTNEARARGATCGTVPQAPAPALRWNDQLAHAARNHALDLGKRRYFDHTTPEGVKFSDRITGAGYVWRTAGENIAAGQPSPAAVVDAWLRSPGHCTNLMNPAFTEMGVGGVRVDGSPYGLYWGQNFGTPR